MNLAFGRRFSQQVGCAITASVAGFLLQSFGAGSDNSVWAKTVPLDEDAMKLVDKLSHNPELMNLDYLRYKLGYPTKTAAGLGSRIYYWYSYDPAKSKSPRSELTQTVDSKGRVTAAAFRMDLPESDIKLTDVYKKEMGEAQQVANNNNQAYGQASGFPSSAASPAGQGGSVPVAGQTPATVWASEGGQRLCKQFYDQNCYPAVQFSFVPKTTVTYRQEQNRFYVNEVEVSYFGPPLPPPAPEHMQTIVDERRTQALALSAKGAHQQAMPLLKEHLKEQPNDAESHYALGLAFQKQSHLNEAILEYNAAMACAGDNNDIKQKCEAGLQELHVLPMPDERVAFHDLQLKAHGQGFREGDEQTSTTRNSLIASQAAPGSGVVNPPMPQPSWTPGNAPTVPPGWTPIGAQAPTVAPNRSSYGYGYGNGAPPPPTYGAPPSPYGANPPAGAPFVNGQQFGNYSAPPSYFSPPPGIRRPSSFSNAANSPGPAGGVQRGTRPAGAAFGSGSTIPGLEPFDPVFMQQPGVPLDPGF